MRLQFLVNLLLFLLFDVHITDASNLVGDMYYWFAWPLNKGQFSNGNKWSGMKVQFLEAKSVFPNTGVNYFTSLQEKKKNKHKDEMKMENLFIGQQIGKWMKKNQ